MKAKQVKIKSKGKPKTDTEKNLEYIKSVRKADREIAIETKTFDGRWATGTKIHVDKKKKKNKQASRKYKYEPNKD
jgi:hypothetical protein